MPKQKQKTTKEKIMKKLEDVLDPELYISIVDLGLIYKVKVTGAKAHISMTLTTMGCPLFDTIEQMVRSKLLELPEIKDVAVELSFDPPWSMERLTERGKAMLGI